MCPEGFRCDFNSFGQRSAEICPNLEEVFGTVLEEERSIVIRGLDVNGLAFVCHPGHRTGFRLEKLFLLHDNIYPHLARCSHVYGLVQNNCFLIADKGICTTRYS